MKLVEDRVKRLEDIARERNYNIGHIRWELVPQDYIIEAASYGLPVRHHHWFFGRIYQRLKTFGKLGYSRIYELVIWDAVPIALLSRDNTLVENTLVAAHVLGHIDFMRTNEVTRNVEPMVMRAAKHADMVDNMVSKYGRDKVEQVLDIALALADHIDIYDTSLTPFEPQMRVKKHAPDKYTYEFGLDDFKVEKEYVDYALPEKDLLRFLIRHAPLRDWEREILKIVRAEEIHFSGIKRTHYMNEGWAMRCQVDLLSNTDILSDDEYVNFMRLTSSVAYRRLRNPYWLGWEIWKYLEKKGVDVEKVKKEDTDYTFLLNYIDKDFVKEHKLFRVIYSETDTYLQIRVEDMDADKIAAILARSLSAYTSVPLIRAEEVRSDGTLILMHYPPEGYTLKHTWTLEVMKNLGQLWRNDIILYTQYSGRKVAYRYYHRDNSVRQTL